MSILRTPEEKMAIAQHCVELEHSGGDILKYLWENNYYTPRATWMNIQREYLGRKPYEFTDGKPKEKKGMTSVALTNEQRLKAAQIAIDGGDPRVYLEECGLIAPDKTWWYLKQWLKKNYPDMADKVPKKLGTAEDYQNVKVDKGMPKEQPEKILGRDREDFEKMPTVAVDGNLNIETPEANMIQVTEVPEKQKITKPLMHSGKKAIGWEGDFGTYIYDRRHGYLDYENNDGDEMSMTVEAWRSWLVEFRDVAQLLGVEL